MNWTTIVNGVESVVQTVEELAPVVGAVGGPAAAGIADIVETAASFTQKVITLAEGVASGISSGDLATIQAANAKLQAQNNALAALIAQS